MKKIDSVAPWVALIGILFVLIGGLFFPLEPGITSVNRSILLSDSQQLVKITTYNFPKNASVNKAWLRTSTKNKQGEYDFFMMEIINPNTVSQDGGIWVKSNIHLGNSEIKNQDLDLIVEYNNEEMYLPKSFYLKRGPLDTVNNASNTANYNTKMRLDSDKKFSLEFPNRITLNESIRNLFYHVPMWFSMILLLAVAAYYGVMYLTKGNLEYEYRFDALIKVGILCGVLGMITGATWARATWGSWWPKDDPKLNGVAIGMLMYFAYLVLRSTLTDPYQRARISAIYSVFIFPIFIALIAIMPKLADNSLHPGSGDSVGFNQYDLNSTLRMFFWPAVVAWMSLFWWIADILFKIRRLDEIQLQKEYEGND